MTRIIDWRSAAPTTLIQPPILGSRAVARRDSMEAALRLTRITVDGSNSGDSARKSSVERMSRTPCENVNR